MGRRLAFDSGVEGQNHFGCLLSLNPIDQPGNAQLFRSDIVKRGKRSAKNMVTSFKGTRSFHCPEVSHILNHADLAIPTIPVTTNAADVRCGNVSAVKAFPRPRRDFLHCISEWCHQ